jgi:hypothetical protein
MFRSTPTRRLAKVFSVVLAVAAIGGSTAFAVTSGGSGDPPSCQVRPGDVITDNSCYRWSHSDNRSSISSASNGSTDEIQVLTENSNYNFQHSEDPR